VRKRVDEAPNDLVDWMTHAVRESANGAGITSRRVKLWKYGLDGQGYGLVGPGGPVKAGVYGHLSPGGSGVEFGHSANNIRR
jgi:hypothetical protein